MDISLEEMVHLFLLKSVTPGLSVLDQNSVIMGSVYREHFEKHKKVLESVMFGLYFEQWDIQP